MTQPHHRWPLAALSALMPVLAPAPAASAGDPPPGGEPKTAFDTVRAWAAPSAGNVEASIRMLSFGVAADPVSDSALNANNLLGLSTYEFRAELRPDVSLHLGSADLMAKPRLSISRADWTEGALAGEQATEEDARVSEWAARVRMPWNMSASYGRENLQWGPSFLLSPSNPFGSANGRDNPMNELAGMEYGKLIWYPDSTWTVSLIANTGDGNRSAPWMGDLAYAAGAAGADASLAEGRAEIADGVALAKALAASERDAARQAAIADYNAAVDWIRGRPTPFPRLGPLVNRALLRGARGALAAGLREVDAGYREGLDLIAEGQAAADAEALAEYDAAVAGFDRNTRDLREFSKAYAVKVDAVLERKFAGLVLSHGEAAGARAGWYGKWDASDATVLYAEGSFGEGADVECLGGVSHTFLSDTTVYLEYFYNGSGSGDLPIEQIVPPYRKVDAREVYLRRNYLLLQAVQADILGRLGLTLRCILNLDDGSDRIIAQAVYDLGKCVDLFAVSAADLGGPDDEFGSAVNYTAMAGLRVSL